MGGSRFAEIIVIAQSGGRVIHAGPAPERRPDDVQGNVHGGMTGAITGQVAKPHPAAPRCAPPGCRAPARPVKDSP